MDMKGLLHPNTTQTPNIIIDWLMPALTGGEFKCLLYIVRRTYGFQKGSDRIALSQFTNGIIGKDGKQKDFGTGLSKQNVIHALEALCDVIGIVKKHTEKNSFSYSIDLEFVKDREEMVQKLDSYHKKKWSKNNTNNSPKIGQVSVQKLDIQNKGNKGNKVISPVSPSLQESSKAEGREISPVPPAPLIGVDIGKGKSLTVINLGGLTLDYNSLMPEVQECLQNPRLAHEFIKIGIGLGLEKKVAIEEFQRFLLRWTEKSPKGRKHRWEMEKTFDVKRRLYTWFNNRVTNFGRGAPQKRGMQVEGKRLKV